MPHLVVADQCMPVSTPIQNASATLVALTTHRPLHQHLWPLHPQVLPKGQHVVPKFVAQQTSVALHLWWLYHEEHLPSIGHSLAAPGLPVPTPGWQEPYVSVQVAPVQPCFALPLHLQVQVVGSNV